MKRTTLFALVFTVAACGSESDRDASVPSAVSGTGVHYFTSATAGQVYLRQSLDASSARWFECDLDVVHRHDRSR